MKNIFWIFALMLMIITVSGSLNNSIYVHENFLEEVLEINENTNEPVQGYDYYPLLATLKSDCDEEDTHEESIEEEEVIAPKKMYVPPVEKVPIQMNKPQPVVKKNVQSVPQMITGYDGRFLAPF